MSHNDAAWVDAETVARLRELGDATGETGFVLGLVDEFATSTEHRLDECRLHVERGNLDELERAGHSLKGSSGTIGASRMRELAAELETAARDGDAATAAATVESLRDALPHTLSALRAAG